MITPEATTERADLLRARLLVFGATFFWSLSGVLVKAPPFEGLPLDQRGPVLACFRALSAAVFLLPFVRWRQVRWNPMLLPMVASFTGMNLLYVTALTRTTAAAAIFLQCTSVVWAFVFGFLFLRERITRGNLIALVFALCGIAWIVAADWASQNFLGNLLALASGVCYAGVVLSLRFLRNENSAWLVTLNHGVSGLVVLPWVLFTGVTLTMPQWSLVTFLGVVQMALPYVLFARAVRTVTAQEAALISLCEPLMNPLWVWMFWGEAVALPTWIGGGLILGGILIRYVLFPTPPAVPVTRTEPPPP